MDAARRVIARDGYLDSRIVDMTREAGKSVGVFYSYFTGKEELLGALAEECRDDVLRRYDAIDPSADTYDVFLAIVRIYWNASIDHGAVILGLTEAAHASSRFGAFLRDLQGLARTNVAHHIRVLQQGGQCPSLDPEQAAHALCSMLDAVCYQHNVRRQHKLTRALDEDEVILNLAQLMFHAVAWSGP